MVMVLIVEDEAMSRRALSSLLGVLGYTIVATSSAEEALRLIRAGASPEFALVDLDLPGMSGIELIPKLRLLRPDIQSVIISATYRERLEKAGDDLNVPFLSKPLHLPDLLELLRGHTPEN